MRTLALPDHPVWDEIRPELVPNDFREPYRMSVESLRKLIAVRRMCGVPFRVVSDFRDSGRNAAAGGARGSAHTGSPCTAVDLRVISSAERYRIVKAAILCGYERFGIYPPTDGQRATWGKNAGSVHLDDSDEHPHEVMWVSA